MNKLSLICFLIFLFSIQIGLCQSSSRANDYVRKADAFKKSAMRDSAIVYYEKAAYEYRLTGQFQEQVDALNELGIILTRQDQYDLALKHLNDALLIGKNVLDSNHLSLATTYLSLGVVYTALEEYDQALLLHFRALEIRLIKLGEYSAEVATSYGNIGNVYLRSKDFDKSIEAHDIAREIRASLFGLNSPEIIESYVGLGNAYREMKKYDASIINFELALQNKIKQRGPGHKDLVRFYRYLSEVYYLSNNMEKGDYYKKEAESIH